MLQTKAHNAKVLAVVKANAYGHGISRTFNAFRGADGFALLDLSDAQELRDLGWRGPILLLEGIFESRDLEICSRLGLWHTVHNAAQLDMLAAHKTHQGHRVFLKLNAGMNRLGFTPVQLRSVWARLNSLPQVQEISLMSHFPRTQTQEDIGESLQIINAAFADLPAERSLSSSGAILGHLDFIAQCGVADDWVRPGIALYGASPDAQFKSASAWGLQCGQSLRSEIIGIQRVSVGDRVGYGGDFVAQEDMLIGVVACGYADGYPRVMSQGAQVMVGSGVRCPLFGRVSMDMLTINLNPALACGLTPDIGTKVTLWGNAEEAHDSEHTEGLLDRTKPAPACLPIDEVAYYAGTIGYELMCGVAARVPVQIDAPV